MEDEELAALELVWTCVPVRGQHGTKVSGQGTGPGHSGAGSRCVWPEQELLSPDTFSGLDPDSTVESRRDVIRRAFWKGDCRVRWGRRETCLEAVTKLQ